MMTTEHLINLVRKNGLELENIPFKDREIVLEAVRQNGMALAYAGSFKDREIVLEAVRKNGLAIKYAGSFIDKALILEAVRQNGLAIKYSGPFLDRDIILEAVRQNGLTIKYSGPFMDKALILEAVRQNGMAVGYAGPFLDKALILEAVRQNGLALGYAGPFLDRDIVLEAVNQNGMALGYAEPFTDKEILKIAVRNNPVSYKYVSPELKKDKEITDQLPPPPPSLKLSRQLSETKSTQGHGNTCSFHSNTRIILQNRFLFVNPIKIDEPYILNKCNRFLITDIKDPTFEDLNEMHCSTGGYNKILLFLYVYHLYNQLYKCGTIPIDGLVTSAIDKMEIPTILASSIHTERLSMLLADIHTKSSGITWQEFPFEMNDLDKDLIFEIVQKVLSLNFYIKLGLSGKIGGHAVTIVSIQNNNYIIKNTWTDIEDIVPSIKFLYLQGVPFVGTRLTFYLPMFALITLPKIEDFSMWLDVYILELKEKKKTGGNLRKKHTRNYKKTKLKKNKTKMKIRL